MTGLIKADMKRLLKNKSTLVCMIIAAVLGIGVALLYRYFWIERGNNIAISYQLMELYGFDTKALDEALSVVPKLDMWSFINAFLSDEFKWILSSICVCSLMAGEFTAGTIRNAVSRGFSRGKIYFSKFIIALIQVFAVTAAYVGSGAVTALFFAKDPVTVKAGDIALAVGTYVILLVATASVFLMLCIIFRRSGMSVATAIAAPLLMVSVLGIFAMANPDSPVSARLVLMETFATVSQYIRTGEGWAAPVIGAVYLAVSYSVGLILFKKSDLK